MVLHVNLARSLWIRGANERSNQHQLSLRLEQIRSVCRKLPTLSETSTVYVMPVLLGLAVCLFSISLTPCFASIFFVESVMLETYACALASVVEHGRDAVDITSQLFDSVLEKATPSMNSSAVYTCPQGIMCIISIIMLVICSLKEIRGVVVNFVFQYNIVSTCSVLSLYQWSNGPTDSEMLWNVQRQKNMISSDVGFDHESLGLCCVKASM